MAFVKETVISAKKLKKSFTTKDRSQDIFDNLDLDIYKGDFTVIMGSSGEIEFCGKRITELSDDQLAVFRRKNCGFVFQQIYLLEKMSLMDNVITAGALVNSNRKEIAKRASELFELVNIPEITQKKFSSQISGGEAQRTGIVRAVINSPEVVFADEPTGALNSNNSDAVLDVFTKLHCNGQSIIMVTHDKKSALRGNRVIYLKDGQIFGECDLGNYHPDNEERKEKLNCFLQEMGW